MLISIMNFIPSLITDANENSTPPPHTMQVNNIDTTKNMDNTNTERRILSFRTPRIMLLTLKMMKMNKATKGTTLVFQGERNPKPFVHNARNKKAEYICLFWIVKKASITSIRT